MVDGLDEAIAHIAKYGSQHTDAIVTDDWSRAQRFLREVDSSSVMVNASTRFADGFEYGLGAEIGISTDKLHARGPVGLEGLTSQKWIVLGDGHVRPDARSASSAAPSTRSTSGTCGSPPSSPRRSTSKRSCSFPRACPTIAAATRTPPTSSASRC